MITNNTSRQKAGLIYDNFFNPMAENCILDIFDTLSFYGVISENQIKKLTKKFENIGEGLYSEMKKYDKKQLQNIKQ